MICQWKTYQTVLVACKGQIPDNKQLKSDGVHYNKLIGNHCKTCETMLRLKGVKCERNDGGVGLITVDDTIIEVLLSLYYCELH